MKTLRAGQLFYKRTLRYSFKNYINVFEKKMFTDLNKPIQFKGEIIIYGISDAFNILKILQKMLF